ncbi:hypothetical protein [Escherichia coli]|uniref:hypothetical protein n=1 Tax=Escherichia coli TaxID=562 RepID=UPI003D9CB9CD
MTETAAAVLHFLPADKWVTPRMMTRTTGVSEARCQLILTQLVLAGLAKDNGGYRTTGVSEARCQLILTQLVLAGLAKDNGGYGNKFRRCQ